MPAMRLAEDPAVLDASKSLARMQQNAHEAPGTGSLTSPDGGARALSHPAARSVPPTQITQRTRMEQLYDRHPCLAYLLFAGPVVPDACPNAPPGVRIERRAAMALTNKARRAQARNMITSNACPNGCCP
jgi:hypothetical protein